MFGVDFVNVESGMHHFTASQVCTTLFPGICTTLLPARYAPLYHQRGMHHFTTLRLSASQLLPVPWRLLRGLCLALRQALGFRARFGGQRWQLSQGTLVPCKLAIHRSTTRGACDVLISPSFLSPFWCGQKACTPQHIKCSIDGLQQKTRTT